jgi:hypothetical protein
MFKNAPYLEAGGRRARPQVWLRWASRYCGYRFQITSHSRYSDPIRIQGLTGLPHIIPPQLEYTTYEWSYLKRARNYRVVDSASGGHQASYEEAQLAAARSFLHNRRLPEPWPRTGVVSTRYFLYELTTRRIVAWCELRLAKDLLSQLDPARYPLGLGRRERTWVCLPYTQVRQPEDTFYYQ